MTPTINVFDLAAQATRYAQAVIQRQQAAEALRDAYRAWKQRHHAGAHLTAGSDAYHAMLAATAVEYQAAQRAKRQEGRERARLVKLAGRGVL